MKKLWTIILPLAAGLLPIPAMAQSDISVVVVPNPIGIPEALIVIALLTFAILRQGWIRIILSLAVFIWGIFFIAYDPKIAGPLMAVGGILAAQGIMAEINQAREAAQEE